jgi:hypothetical protein
MDRSPYIESSDTIGKQYPFMWFYTALNYFNENKMIVILSIITLVIIILIVVYFDHHIDPTGVTSSFTPGRPEYSEDKMAILNKIQNSHLHH